MAKARLIQVRLRAQEGMGETNETLIHQLVRLVESEMLPGVVVEAIDIQVVYEPPGSGVDLTAYMQQLLDRLPGKREDWQDPPEGPHGA